MRILLLVICSLLIVGCGNGSGEDAGQQLIVVANRTSGSLSIIDPASDAVLQTVPLPPAASPIVAGYVVYSPLFGRLYVGDEANRRVIVLRASDFAFITNLTMPQDTFHMWLHDARLWVVDRKDFSVAVFDLASNSRVAVIPVPADLRALGGVPHDVVVDQDHAYVTVLNVTGAADVVVKYSGRTLTEVGRASVGEDPHVFLHPTNRRLYVACQDTDNVFVLDRDTMAEETVVPILGGHGVWVPPHGQSLYVTNFPGHVPGGLPGPGADGVFTVNLDTHAPIGGVTVPFSSPHNLCSTADGRKLYLTHSNGGIKVTVYDLPDPTMLPVFLTEIDVGDNPFGICRID